MAEKIYIQTHTHTHTHTHTQTYPHTPTAIHNLELVAVLDVGVAAVVVILGLAGAGRGAVSGRDPQVAGACVEDHLFVYVDVCVCVWVGVSVGERCRYRQTRAHTHSHTYLEGLPLGAHVDLTKVLGIGDVRDDNVTIPRVAIVEDSVVSKSKIIISNQYMMERPYTHTHTHTHKQTHCCGWLKMLSITWLVGRFLRGMRICACVSVGVWRRRRRGRRKRRDMVFN